MKKQISFREMNTKKILYQKPDLEIIEIETEDVMGNSPSQGGPSDGEQGGQPKPKTIYNNSWSSEIEPE